MIEAIWRKFRINRTATKVVLLIVFFIFLAVFCLSFVFNKMIPDDKREAFLYYNPLLASSINKIKKFTDILYLPYFFKNSDLRIYELEVEDKDIKKMIDSLPEDKAGFYTDKVYVPAELKVEGKKYKVNIRIRGLTASNWINDKKSYLIKFDNDNLWENGTRRLSFIVPSDRLFAVEHFNNYRADKLGLMHPESDFGILKINGKNYGVYFLIENWSEEMIAKWGVPDQADLYSGSYSFKWISGSIEDESDEAFDNLGPWAKQQEDGRFNFDNYAEMYQLIDLVNNSSDEEFHDQIFDLIDKENFFNWVVHQNLASSVHQNGHNLRLYFNNSLGKFYFIPWDVMMYPVKESVDNFYNKIVSRVLADSQYMHERNKKLWDYVSKKENLEDDLIKYDEIFDRIKIDIYKNRDKLYSNRDFDSEIAEKRNYIVENFNHIKSILSEADANVSILVGNDNPYLAAIDIKVDNFSGLLLNGLEFEFANEYFNLDEYSLYYDINHNNIFDSDDRLTSDHYQPLIYTNRRIDNTFNAPFRLELTSHRFFLVNNKVNSDEFIENLVDFKFNFSNAITGKKIKQKDIDVKIVDKDTFDNLDSINDVEKFISSNSFFQVNKNSKEIVLQAGLYNINKNLIIPRGYRLIIKAGVNLRFAPEVSLVSYSPISAEGTKSAPIIFTAQDRRKNWGNVFVLNNNKKNIFKNTIFEYGGDSYINGAYASGMLALHNTGEILVENSVFRFASGDDALNIKWGKAFINNNIFDSNQYDAIDLDWADNSVVENNKFLNNGNDGIDIGGGDGLKIKGNTVDISGDKCISIGESAKDILILNNWLNNCVYGIAIKDNSEVNFSNNTLLHNQIGVGVYQKKPVWGGADVEIINSIIWYNDQISEVGEKSTLQIKYSDVQGGFEGEGNIDIEPIYDDNKKILNKQEELLKGANTEFIKDYLEVDSAPMGVF